MKLIKVGAAVLNQTPRDWKGNRQNIVDAIVEARKQRVTVLCLPELCASGYGLEDDFFCHDVHTRSIIQLKSILRTVEEFPFPTGCIKNEDVICNKMIVCIGLPIRFNNSLYNAVATIVDGFIVGFTCKQHLAGDGIHYEPRWFKPWPKGVVQTIDIPELGSFPIGDIHFNIGGAKIGYEICEDAWVANRPGTVLASKGVDIYLNPSASHFSFGKLNVRKNFVVDGSRAFNATYVYANLVGNEAGRAIYDGGALIASGGNLVAAGKRFTFRNFLLTSAVVDVDNTKTAQTRTSSFQPDVEKYNEGCIEVPFVYPYVAEPPTENTEQEEWEKSPFIKHEECTRALGLSLMDFARKSKTNGFVVSLSGGADSAMVTYIAATGIRLGMAELGNTEFINKFFPYLNGLSVHTPRNIIKQLITTAYQATENSGQVTKNAAEKVAENIGTTHFDFDVQPVFNEYLKIGEKIKGNPLNFEDDDITLQNLQARTRSPSIWIVANMFRKLLLTTSNMSEAAVGYATMDGDTSGCVAPIGGLPKVYIREYLEWVAEYGPTERGFVAPVRAIRLITEQQPTAELRPAQYKQTDEDDLMPYWLLHAIEKMVVKSRYSPVEIYHALRLEYKNYDNNRLIKDITKFFRLFSRNQWKRERYALSFHMDDHNLDPRTWCRTPILTGGYEEELAELDKFLHHEGK
jgi:NAD+ synthase (glutamine-hydrolysing)